MSGASVERRLAAILAADVAGDSRFMDEDKAGVPWVDAARKGVSITASGWQRF